MTDFSVVPVPIYQDNYVWIILSGEAAWVVDPGDHRPVIAALEDHGRRPTGVLVTHHHWDHITGVEPLINHYGGEIPVYGPRNSAIPGVNRAVGEGDRIPFGSHAIEVWETPGHTRDHLSYYLPWARSLFCGDTLFSAGCGRLYDGSMEQLYASLRRIAQLPGDTDIYCTHEYTLANLDFALAVESRNPALLRRRQEALRLRHQQRPTLPTRLAAELQFNPFLRTSTADVCAAVKNAAGLVRNDDFLIFAELRKWKNRH